MSLFKKSISSRNLFSNPVRLILKLVFNKKSLVSILFTLATNLSYTVLLTTSFFTTLLSLLKSTGTVANLPISNLSNSVFKLAKFVFNAKFEVSA